MSDKLPERTPTVHDEAALEARRRFLVRALSSGLLLGGAGWNLPALAALFGKLPGKMPAGKSVFDLKGTVKVDGQPATRDTLVTAQSRVETSADSFVILAVGDGAFIVRERSVLELSGKQLLVRGLQMLTGGLLSVFGHRGEDDGVEVNTPTATIGIRGTGFYTESAADKTYFCTCYGRTRIGVAGAGESEEVVSKHHDAPRWILARPDQGRRIVPAPFRNHTDLELMTLEALCGRQVPFVVPEDSYQAPRRDY
ncbi:MAG: FecR domain-containing protein [Nevskia sp.]|nr:FecR domain-containing protein [Nevskia sp.]